MKNLFIAFEGIDGCGKSTQVKLLAKQLEENGHRIYTTFEPTNNPIGNIIRSIFTHNMDADHRTIAALFVADRLHHLLNKNDGILKKLSEGYTVLTDRYYFSSYAYHSVHMPIDWVIEANAMSAELLKPDLNIYIDIDPLVSMERISTDRKSTELYETIENLTLVRKNYLLAFEKLASSEKVFSIEGNKDQQLIADEIWREIQNCYSA